MNKLIHFCDFLLRLWLFIFEKSWTNQDIHLCDCASTLSLIIWWKQEARKGMNCTVSFKLFYFKAIFVFFLLTFLAFLLLQFSPFLENMSPFLSWLKSLFLLNYLQNDLFLVHLSCRLKMGKHPLQTSWGLCWCIIRTD